MKKLKPSQFDNKCYTIIRKNINRFLREAAQKYDHRNSLILDIAPQIHNVLPDYFKKSKIETLDINSSSGATYIADITKHNKFLRSKKFHIIVCAEVLEHVSNPFDAIKEIHRLLKPSGVLLLTVPFNFRVHGPLPDFWRFTDYGLRRLLQDFQTIDIKSTRTTGRDLMPIHYTVIATKAKHSK